MKSDPTYFEGFSPPFLMGDSITQTLLGHFSNRSPVPNHKVYQINLDDGDSLTLDIDSPELAGSSPILMMFHGLGGCSDSSYLLSIAKLARKESIRTVRFNHRGCGKYGRKLAKKIYHSGRIDDMLSAIKNISQLFPKAPIFLCGFSLSGNMLLSMLAKRKDEIKKLKNVKAALAVCPPLDLEKSSIRMTLSKNKIFNIYFGRRLISELKRMEVDHNCKLIQKAKERISLRDFDEVYTAPLAGYKSRRDYYVKNSSKNVIQNIELETKILAAKDDPIIDNTDLQTIKLPPSVSAEIQNRGGHMGFIHKVKSNKFGRRWMDFKVLNWVLTHLP